MDFGWWCGALKGARLAMAEVAQAGLLPSGQQSKAPCPVWSELPGREPCPWRTPRSVVCVGWSDLFYVPLRLADPYDRLAQLFHRNHVPNEISTWTILVLLANRDGRSFGLVECAGGAAGQLHSQGCGNPPQQVRPPARLSGRTAGGGA